MTSKINKQKVDGIEYSEDGINCFAEEDTRDKFDEYSFLIFFK